VEFLLFDTNDLTWCIVVTEYVSTDEKYWWVWQSYAWKRPMIHFKLYFILTFHSAKFQLVYSMFSPIIQIEVTIYEDQMHFCTDKLWGKRTKCRSVKISLMRKNPMILVFLFFVMIID
jgi:hypothetical protein